ncbi:MAG: outer membrane protein transport protein [Deltaproteobacteria bacterium]|nr:outer membrane protein transport protein [Deltaproteobacteria bacterium]
MNTRIVKIVGTFVGALLFVPVTPASAQMAQLYEDFGVGPRDSAMGNTGTAVANDFSAAFYNPAALVRSKGLALDFGYKGVYPQLKIKIGRYGDREFTRYPTTDLFLFGLTWNFKMDKLIDPKWTERFTVGFAFAFSDYFKSFTIYYDQDTPFFYRYHDRYLNLLPIYLSLGVRVTDWFSIGAGMVPAPSDTYTDVTVDSHITAPEYSYTATQGTVTRSYGKLEPVVGALSASRRVAIPTTLPSVSRGAMK